MIVAGTLLFSSTAPAFAETYQAWSATLTVGNLDPAQKGYSASGSNAGGALSETSFTLGGTEYTIESLLVSNLPSFDELAVVFDKPFLHETYFWLGTQLFILPSSFDGGTAHVWQTPRSQVPTDWTTGQTIDIRFMTAAHVTAMDLTSNPGTDRRYKIGDTVSATVTFNEALKPITGGPPQLEFDINGTARAGDCALGTDTSKLVCSITIAEGDNAPRRAPPHRGASGSRSQGPPAPRRPTTRPPGSSPSGP